MMTSEKSTPHNHLDYKQLNTPAKVREMQWDMDAVKTVCDKYAAEICAYAPDGFIDNKEIQLGIIGRLNSLMLIERILRYTELPKCSEMVDCIMDTYNCLRDFIKPIYKSGAISRIYKTMLTYDCTAQEASDMLYKKSSNSNITTDQS